MLIFWPLRVILPPLFPVTSKIVELINDISPLFIPWGKSTVKLGLILTIPVSFNPPIIILLLGEFISMPSTVTLPPIKAKVSPEFTAKLPVGIVSIVFPRVIV